ncbi:hypothetical protein BKA56DRAFT_22126 [Ilyonectria sp. MPI-CAGE-AT-0026]|nr:hypothetical protein BKA56DRAFT_22126 [Ilyonectria sp. MPI-CAGE-AT-0026]
MPMPWTKGRPVTDPRLRRLGHSSMPRMYHVTWTKYCARPLETRSSLDPCPAALPHTEPQQPTRASCSISGLGHGPCLDHQRRPRPTAAGSAVVSGPDDQFPPATEQRQSPASQLELRATGPSPQLGGRVRGAVSVVADAVSPSAMSWPSRLTAAGSLSHGSLVWRLGRTPIRAARRSPAFHQHHHRLHKHSRHPHCADQTKAMTGGGCVAP